MYSFHPGSYTPTRGCLVRFFHAPELVYGRPCARSSWSVCKSLVSQQEITRHATGSTTARSHRHYWCRRRQRLPPRARAFAWIRAPSWWPLAMPAQTLLEKRRRDWSIDYVTTDYHQVCEDPQIDAVIIATPNFTHLPISLAAAAHGKHVMCEKPLGLNAAGSAHDVPRGARCRRCAYDGLHLSICTLHALHEALASLRCARHAATLPQPAVPGSAGNELGMATVSGQSGCRRPV